MRSGSEWRPSPGRRVRGKPSRRKTSYGHGQGDNPDDESPTPICRCRVLYLGSAVPHATKDGLQGIQEPLRELYPEEGAPGAKGIDSWLSVWSNGFLLENMDENRKKVTRFFPVESLHYCAAVRYVLVPSSLQNDHKIADKVARFLPLDSPFARTPSAHHPPLFAAILRRTSGIKVLECHIFICKRETAANALVRCAFHAYADSTYAKHLESGASLYGTVGGPTPVPAATPVPGMNGVYLAAAPANHSSHSAGGTLQGIDMPREYQQSVMEMSEDSINSIDKVDDWKIVANGKSDTSPRVNGDGRPEDGSAYTGDENHKVWAAKSQADTVDGIYGDYGSTMRSFRSSASGLSYRHRPRQMVMPSSPPPPPIPEEVSPVNGTMNGHIKDRLTHDKKHPKHRRHRSASRDSVDAPNATNTILRAPGPRGPSMNGHGPSRVWPSAGPQGGHPPMVMVPVPSAGAKKSGTFSARQKGPPRGVPTPFLFYGGMSFGPPLAPFGPPNGYYPPPARPASRSIEEPIHYPQDARPLSPVASYRPTRFPHEAYLAHRAYATVDKANRNRRGPQVGPGFADSKKRRSKNQSSESNADDSEEEKKHHGNGQVNGHSHGGHGWWTVNGRRSRSIGSLEPPSHPDAAGSRQNGRHGNNEVHGDVLQMMGDLDLSDDRLERSEVPPGLYPPGPPPNMIYAAHPPMMVMPQDLAAHHHAITAGRSRKKR